MKKPAFYVINADNQTSEFQSEFELAKWLQKASWIRPSVRLEDFGHTFNDTRFISAGINIIRVPVEYVVFDQYFRVVDRNELRELFEFSIPYIPWFRYPSSPGFRNGPIPGTGNSRYYRFCRRPRTTQERRLSLSVPQKYVRGCRRANTLPESWDDLHRADLVDKHSWKKQKKQKQWMRS